MLLSHRKKFIYTKTVKTAGTSIESYFERYCLPEGEWRFSHSREEHIGDDGIVGYRGRNSKGVVWRNHMPAAAIRDRVGNEVWENYFKFCVIRNPFTKLVSAYYMFVKEQQALTTKQRIAKQIKKISGRANAIDLVTGKTDIDRFRSWIKNGGWVNDRDKYLIDGQVCVDYFIRYEDIENGLKHVCEVLQVPYELERLPKLKGNISKRSLPISAFYDDETTMLVKKIYDFEFSEFGYTLPE